MKVETRHGKKIPSVGDLINFQLAYSELTKKLYIRDNDTVVCLSENELKQSDKTLLSSLKNYEVLSGDNFIKVSKVCEKSLVEGEPTVDVYTISLDADKLLSFTNFDSSEIIQRLVALENRVDNDTVYDDSEVKERLTALENREDKDSIYDDTEVKERLTILENKVDNDTIYDDTDLQNRVKALEEREDKDTVYSAGDNITIDEDGKISANIPEAEKYDDTEIRERIEALENREDNDTTYSAGENVSIDENNVISVELPEGYDDSSIKELISVIEKDIEELKSREDKDTTYTAGVGVEITKDNVINVKIDHTDIENAIARFEEHIENDECAVQDIVDQDGNSLVHNHIYQVPAEYDDSALTERITALENKEEKTYTSGNYINVDSNNSINLDDEIMTQIMRNVSEIDALKKKKDNDTTYTAGENVSIDENNVISVRIPEAEKYDDTEVKERLTELENKEDKDTVYDDSEIKERIEALESRKDKDTQYTAGNHIEITDYNEINAKDVLSVGKGRYGDSNNFAAFVYPFYKDGEPACSILTPKKTVASIKLNDDGDLEIVNQNITGDSTQENCFTSEQFISLPKEYDDTDVKDRLTTLENKKEKTLTVDATYNAQEKFAKFAIKQNGETMVSIPAQYQTIQDIEVTNDGKLRLTKQNIEEGRLQPDLKTSTTEITLPTGTKVGAVMKRNSGGSYEREYCQAEITIDGVKYVSIPIEKKLIRDVELTEDGNLKVTKCDIDFQEGTSYPIYTSSDEIIELPKGSGEGTTYDDTEVKERLTALESKEDKDTVYDDTEIRETIDNHEGRVQRIEARIVDNAYSYLNSNPQDGEIIWYVGYNDGTHIPGHMYRYIAGNPSDIRVYDTGVAEFNKTFGTNIYAAGMDYSNGDPIFTILDPSTGEETAVDPVEYLISLGLPAFYPWTGNSADGIFVNRYEPELQIVDQRQGPSYNSVFYIGGDSRSLSSNGSSEPHLEDVYKLDDETEALKNRISNLELRIEQLEARHPIQIDGRDFYRLIITNNSDNTTEIKGADL